MIVEVEMRCRISAKRIDQQRLMGLFPANAFGKVASRFAQLPVHGSSFAMQPYPLVPAWIIRTMR
jgi:hypothetical protein